jgi:hypothetical protein
MKRGAAKGFATPYAGEPRSKKVVKQCHKWGKLKDCYSVDIF